MKESLIDLEPQISCYVAPSRCELECGLVWNVRGRMKHYWIKNRMRGRE